VAETFTEIANGKSMVVHSRASPEALLVRQEFPV
jgi:hypothetical protein